MKLSLNSLLFGVLLMSGCSDCQNKHQTSRDLKRQVPEIASGLDKALSEVAGKAVFSENIQFQSLGGGMTSAQLFTFELAGQKYVLRTLKTHHPLSERINEMKAHAFAAEIGIAPRIVYLDPEYRFVIMDYIDGHTITREELRDEHVLKRLGIMIAKLHSYKGDFSNYRPQIARAKKHYERAVNKKGIAMPSSYSKLYDDFISEGKSLQKQDQVLCHADLNAANILVSKSGQIYIIDWPTATIDNRYADLGYFTFLNGIDDDSATIFLEAYLGCKPKPEQWKRLKQAQRRTSFLTSVVWFDFSESKEDKSVSKLVRIKNLDRLLESPSLLTAKDYIDQNIVVSPMSKDTKAIRLYALGFLKTYMEWEKSGKLSN